jgi:hypothetical protein
LLRRKGVVAESLQGSIQALARSTVSSAMAPALLDRTRAGPTIGQSSTASSTSCVRLVMEGRAPSWCRVSALCARRRAAERCRRDALHGEDPAGGTLTTPGRSIKRLCTGRSSRFGQAGLPRTWWMDEPGLETSRLPSRGSLLRRPVSHVARMPGGGSDDDRRFAPRCPRAYRGAAELWAIVA